jgi:uncharacterized protein YbcV (DUF1398 family)
VTEQMLSALIERARSETSSYPQYAAQLARDSIEGYHVDVAAHTIDWRAPGVRFRELGPVVIAGGAPVAFAEAAVVRALRRNQQGQTDYPGFLREIWAAGVCAYDADLRGGCVVYRGASGEQYVEAIPPVT